jgi:hypothetical protein
MLLACRRVEAIFSGEGLRLGHDGETWVRGAEHGGYYILRVAGLEVKDLEGRGGEPGIVMEISLEPAEAVAEKIKVFASHHGLTLTAPAPPAGQLELAPILAACHLPGKSLFIFCEEPQLTIRPLGAGTVELSVTGPFKSRRLPCQETDLVIHVEMAAMAQLLSWLWGQVRGRP